MQNKQQLLSGSGESVTCEWPDWEFCQRRMKRWNGTTNKSMSGSIHRDWEGKSDGGRGGEGGGGGEEMGWSEKGKHKEKSEQSENDGVRGGKRREKNPLDVRAGSFFSLVHSLWVLVCVCLRERESIGLERWEMYREREREREKADKKEEAAECLSTDDTPQQNGQVLALKQQIHGWRMKPWLGLTFTWQHDNMRQGNLNAPRTLCPSHSRTVESGRLSTGMSTFRMACDEGSVWYGWWWWQQGGGKELVNVLMRTADFGATTWMWQCGFHDECLGKGARLMSHGGFGQGKQKESEKNTD